MADSVRVLELFCGIGGCAAALGSRGRVVAAIDISHRVLDIYSQNFPHPTIARTIESMETGDYRKWEADLWWLSPPCQPYTQRGLQRDLADPRAAGLLAVIDQIPRLLPRHIALENVPPFQTSQSCRRLRETLDRCQYHQQEQLLCPTELGIPNRRRRFYLVATRGKLRPFPMPTQPMAQLSDFLDERPDPALALPDTIVRQYAEALDVVDPDDDEACSACFTSAYGRSHIRSGSYLTTPQGLRRFSPREILRLLGFPATFHLPQDVTLEQAWRSIGNSLSVVAVRHVLSAVMGE